MLEQIASHVRNRESFAFETTLSGLAYSRHIPEWQALGYRLELFFLTLPSAEAALERVAKRVRQGGHNVPEAVVRRRFAAGWRNFQATYRALVDAWALYDNVGIEPVLLDWGERHEPETD